MPKITLNAIELFYEIHGAGEPLLLIHGLGSSSRDWEYQLPAFTEHYQVITCDVRGHGQSAKPPGPYNVPMFADDIIQLMQALDIAPAHVLGISMGGMIAYQLAVDHPEMVKSLIAVNCNPELPVRNFKDRLAIWQREIIVQLIGMRKMGQVLSERLFIKPDQEKLRQIFVQRWAENDPKAYLAAMRAIVGWSVVAELPKLTMPVLVIAADQDYSFVDDKTAYIPLMPNAQMLVIENSRHATPVEHPEAFNQAVLSFYR
ncbi:MAG: alpha/beta fold hydrolase [Anaerolineales bacterium]|nr:alpha/beta fold hydrolase [Anaerolineales bacterium]